jgi:hypothetical protein
VKVERPEYQQGELVEVVAGNRWRSEHAVLHYVVVGPRGLDWTEALCDFLPQRGWVVDTATTRKRCPVCVRRWTPSLF